MTHSDLYGTFFDDITILTSDAECESETGCAAYPSRALLSPWPADAVRRSRFERRLRELGRDGETSVFRDAPGELLAHSEWLASADLVLHEGYRFDPATEGAVEMEKLRADLGDQLWATPPDVWLAWANKGPFRRRCRALLGARSVPPGIETSATDAADVVDALRRFDADPDGRTIVKLPGGGGVGNLVLTPTKPESWPDRIQELWTERVPGPSPTDVVIEHWLPWETSYSVSFLLVPGRTPVPLAACEQIVDTALGEWVGSRSHGSMDDADVSAMNDRLAPVFADMASDGVVGVAALDVVVGSATAWPDVGFTLPSGRRLCVIECNPRFNQHNRIGLIVERLSRRWGTPAADLSWQIRNVDPPAGSSLEALLEALEGDGPMIPDAPTFDRPVRVGFAHRHDKLMELTVGLVG